MTPERMILHHYGEVSSTSDLVKEMADMGAPEWTTVVAQSQSAGRGRMGRPWHSPRGNLYLSVLLKPEILSSELPRMSILASLAVFMAIFRENSPLNLKWPNDILLNGRKIAGVLLEGRTQNDRVEYVVVGLGINMKLDDVHLPPDLTGRVASVHEIDQDLKVNDLIILLEKNLIKYCRSYRGRDWSAARTEWLRYAIGETKCQIGDSNEKLTGRPVDMTDEGWLVLDTDQGLVTLRSGDLQGALE
ncbi:biotin--[acetyl-CoA-carboxylase] ligase [bacterium]|nr:MAG: biotin--[acetyl-CoA-carboxylase] ligase [bacterium]